MRGRRYPPWSLKEIKEGIDRYFLEKGVFPTSRDFDLYPFLPSARQVQRAFGGLETLRRNLGYTDTNYTKGTLRTAISNTVYRTSTDAEDYFEDLLTKKFGEPFVHTQKRYYKQMKNRYDFFIYCQNNRFGVDVFATGRSDYIDANVRHKVKKYKDIPHTVKIYFVVINPKFTATDVLKGISGIKNLRTMPNVIILRDIYFIKELEIYEPLELPETYKSVYS